MNFLSNKKIYIIAAIIVIVTIGGYIYKKSKIDEQYLNDNVVQDNDQDGTYNETEGNNISEDNILVHVTGCVKKQGLVTLKNSARIIDAIKEAGGETEEADLNKLNLAYVLQDGDKLYVPSKEDKNEEQEYISTDSGQDVVTGTSGAKEDAKEKVVNINTATKDELTTLSGIGESTANKIIAYRKENGLFKSKDEIKKVPGIGDAKYANIKDKIKIN